MEPDLSQHLESYNEIIGLLCELVTGMVDKNYINTVLVSGPAGVGKSYNVDQLLQERQEREENPIRYIKFSGHVTPRAFYEKLKENSSEDCILSFDDADSIVTNEDSVNLLKAAAERTKRRHINWVSSLSKSEGFDFEGKIIIITNIVVSQSPHLKAIKDRFHLFNMDVSYEQKIAKIQDIANATIDPTQLRINKEVVAFLLDNKDKINSDTISIRTFKKLTEIAMLMPDKWKRFVDISGTYFDKASPALVPIVKRKYTKRSNIIS